MKIYEHKDKVHPTAPVVHKIPMKEVIPPRRHKLFYGSSYDRGLVHLLKMWPEIKSKYIAAELHVAYGWNLFDAAYADNPERQSWKDRINKLMEAPGITHHGRLSKDELKKLEQECGIWAYPTHFGETNCITALDCQAQGCVPCVVVCGALDESVQSGIKIVGDIYDDETQKAYLEALLQLMDDERLWGIQQKEGQDFAKSFTWNNIALAWSHEFEA